MDSKSIAEKIKTISDFYGYDAESRQCIEEMAELIQAINKFWRKELDYGRKDISQAKAHSNERKNLVEEIADVQVTLYEMGYLLDEKITEIIERKIDRQIKRIEEEKREIPQGK